VKRRNDPPLFCCITRLRSLLRGARALAPGGGDAFACAARTGKTAWLKRRGACYALAWRLLDVLLDTCRARLSRRIACTARRPLGCRAATALQRAAAWRRALRRSIAPRVLPRWHATLAYQAAKSISVVSSSSWRGIVDGGGSMA